MNGVDGLREVEQMICHSYIKHQIWNNGLHHYCCPLPKRNGSVLQGTGRKGNMAAAQQPENGQLLGTWTVQQGRAAVRPRVRHAQSLPETPTLAAYKDYKAIIILLGMSTTHYAILDELAEQHRKAGRDTRTDRLLRCAPLDATGTQYLCNVYNTVCHAFHLLREKPVRDNRLLVTEKELRHAERMLPELGEADVHRNGASERLHGLWCRATGGQMRHGIRLVPAER